MPAGSVTLTSRTVTARCTKYPPGRGTAPLREYLAALVDTGFDGALSLELGPAPAGEDTVGLGGGRLTEDARSDAGNGYTRRRSPDVNLEVGLTVEGQEGVSWPQWLDLARVAEEYGFAALYRSDHYLSEHPGSNRDSLDAWGTICGLAAVTSRIRLGTLVSPVTFRHPSVLAKLAVTADHISGGRVDVGIGAGWYREEHVAYGFEMTELRVRMEILEEQLEIVAPGPGARARSHSRADTTTSRTSTPGRNRLKPDPD